MENTISTNNNNKNHEIIQIENKILTSNLILEKIRNQIEVKKLLNKKSQKSLVIFDLDGTIFNNFPRQMRIFKEILLKKYPVLNKPDILKRLEGNKQNKYSILNILKNSVKDQILFKEIKVDFLKYFLSNKYLKYDQLYPGFLDFFDKIKKFDVEILFLTGRPQVLMEFGTLKAIISKKIFKHKDKIYIFMKKNGEEEDFVYKNRVLSSLKENRNYKIIAFFENEDVNCKTANKYFKDTLIFQYMSSQSNDEEFDGFKFKNWKD